MASWKKIIVSGSNAELNHITSSGNLEVAGNISGSSTSTGSFGRLELLSKGSLRINQGGRGDEGSGNNNGITLFQSTTFTGNLTTTANLFSRIFDDNKLVLANHFNNAGGGISLRTMAGGSQTSAIDIAGNTGLTTINKGIVVKDSATINTDLIVTGSTSITGDLTVTGSISGSATSTGSFGRVEATTFVGDGSELTGLTSAAIETYNSSGDNRILTSVNSTTVQGEAGLTFDGSELRVQGDIVAENFIVSSSVTYMTQSFSSGSTIFGDTIDDTHVFTGSLLITGSQTLVGRITPTEIGAFTAKGAIDFDNQNLTNIDIDSGDIASGVTINKSPVVNFNSGDVQGSITLSNLASGTGGLTIQSDSVEGTMLNTNVADTSTIELSSDTLSVLKVPNALTVDNATIALNSGTTFDGSGARTISVKDGGIDADALATSVAGDGLSGGGGTALSVDLSGLSSVSIGASTSEVTIGDNLTIAGNLIVQGDTVQQQVANLNVEDRFILLNSGSASGDGGIVVQTESANGDGVAFAYDDSESRWAFQQGTKLNASASVVAPDAYASAVVTSDDSNYQKNGNIRVEGGEIYIYVE